MTSKVNVGVRFFFTFIFIFILIIGSKSHADESNEFQSALKFYNAKDYTQSRHAFFELVKRHPANSTYWFNLGNSYYMLGQYRFAVRCYNHVIKANNGLKVAAEWYRAKALYHLGYNHQAMIELKKILRYESPSRAIRSAIEGDLQIHFNQGHSTKLEFEALHLYQQRRYDRALQTLDQIPYPSKHAQILKGLILKKMNRLAESRQILKSINSPEARNLLDEISLAQVSRKKIWGYINASLGQEANVYQVPSYSSPTSRSISEDFWGLGGELHRWNDRYLLLNYYGNLYNVFSISNLQMISHRLWLTYGFTKRQWHIQVGPYYEIDDWGGSSAYNLTGVKAKAFKYANHLQWGTSADIGSQSATPKYSYMSGTVSSLRLYGGYVKDPIFAQLYFVAERNAIGDITFINGNVLPEGQDDYGIGGRWVWKVNGDWTASGRLALTDRNFIDHAVPNKARTDNETEIEVRAIRTWTRQLSGYLSLSDTSNNSTLGRNDVVDMNYNDQIFLLGVAWSSL